MNIPSHNAEVLETQLRKILSGVEKNMNDWPDGNHVDKKIILKASEELKEKLKQIMTIEDKLTSERKKLQQFADDFAKPLYKKARDRAYSLYGKNSEKLSEYNLNKV